MDIDRLVDGVEPTVKSYWDFSEKRKQSGTVIKIACDGDFCYVVLEQTIFHPETDEQEGDSGWIRGKNGSLHVKRAIIRHGVIIHEGKMEGNFELNEEVEAEVYWPSRKNNVKMHALGHILKAAIVQVKPKAEITSFRMSSPGFIHVRGGLTGGEVEKIREAAAILKNQVGLRFMNPREFMEKSRHVPKELPETSIRVCSVGPELMTCGGVLPRSAKNLEFGIIGMRGEKLIFGLE